ncbi:MAG: phosphoenolpyruvate--protein phosphotransferase [Verrucomicrobia bacterium A1]|nr:MAG: phosphoenolpyruvate--protein phosphotransferase [Verrucomicrobia bacterium A1]
MAHLDRPHIVIANDLAPSDTATLNREKVIAFATDLGSPTSHTAIMARALAIPAVVGLHDVSVRVSPGDEILIDGHKGLMVIRPSAERLEHYGKIAKVRHTIQTRLAELKDLPAVTKDGYQVMLSANIELPGDVDAVFENGATGVGLFRTEYLYLSMKQLPTEEEQFAAYEEVAKRVAPAPAIIRTLDLGGDKFLSQLKTPAELNPFMGWRAIRFCLAQPDIFKTQLRAILRASRHENVKLMYPMVSNVEEVLRANTFLQEAKFELREQGLPFNDSLEVGVMIEVPSAAITANLIAPHVDFFSLGTNDLVQYTLAVDRVNERVAYLYEPTHPAIIRLIKNTIDVGHDHGIWVGVCGEMAANPIMAPLLMGLGLDEFSMSPTAVPLVKDVVRALRFSDSENLAKAVLASESASEVLALCRELAEKVTPEILELVG